MLLLLSLLYLVSPVLSDLASQSCSVTGNSVHINPDADANIAVVFGLRKPGKNGYGCGELTDSVQYVEAISWALNRINQNSGNINGNVITQSYVPGVQIGASISDSCHQPYLSTQSAVERITSLHTSQYQCQKNNSKIFLGVIGERNSEGSESLSSVLQYGNFSQISFTAPGSELSEEPGFMRTTTSNAQTAKALVSLLHELQWERYSVIYTDQSMYKDIYHQVLSEATTRGHCISAVTEIEEGSSDSVLKSAIQRSYDSNPGQVLYIGPSSLAEELTRVAATIPEAFNLQWVVSFGRNNTWASQSTYNNGIMTIEPRQRLIAEFEDHMVRIIDTETRPNNPWYKEAYMTVNKCKLPGVTSAQFASLPPCTLMTEAQKRSSFVQQSNVESAIVAVYTYANALKKAHSALCGGTPGLCANLAAMTAKDFHDKYLKVVDFTFTVSERVPTLASSSIPPYNAPKRVYYDSNGNILDMVYDIYNYNLQYVQVGSYVAGSIILSKSSIVMYANNGKARTTILASLPIDVCTASKCAMCVREESMNKEQTYLHIPGDLLIGSTFAVHTPGMSWTQCDYRFLDPLNGAQFVQAFIFAINEVNKNKVLRNLKLGGIAFDNCMSHVLKSAILTDFHTGKLKVKDSEGRVIDPMSVSAYIGGLESNIAESLEADIVGPSVPVLSYGNPNIPQTQPYLTVIPFTPIMDHGKALGALLTNVGHTYVSVIYEHTLGSDLQHEKVEHILEDYGICVARVYEAFTVDEYRKALKEADKHTEAKALVFVSATPHFGHLIEAIHMEGLENRFTLVGLEMAGKTDRPSNVVTWRNNITDYMLTLSIPHPITPRYRQYLDGLDPMTYKTNPWFRAWYENLYNCSLTNTTNSYYATLCANNKLPITSAPSYLESPLNDLVTNGVYKTADAIHKSLQHYCGENYTEVCAAFRSAANRGQKITEYLRKGEFYDLFGVTAHIDSFYKTVSSTDINYVKNGKYSKVGQYQIATADHPEYLTLNHSLIMSKFMTPSTCSGLCTQCLGVTVPGSSQVIEGNLLIGGLFDIHNGGKGLFSCAEIRDKMAYQHYAAFMYALDLVNSGKGPVSLPGIKLGSVAMDTCVHAIRGATLMTGLHSKLFEVDDVNIDDIIGWVTFTKDEPGVMAATATDLALPLIGPSPVRQSEMMNYGGYYAMAPTLDQHAKGLSRVISSFGWKYVHMVVENHTNARVHKAHMALMESLRGQSICVLDHFKSPQSHSQVINSVVTSPTRVVVIVGDSILPYIKARNAAGSSAQDIVFILAQISPNMTSLSGPDARGVIVASLDTQTVPGFDQYIGTWTLTDHREDMWFVEYFQLVHQCDYGISFHYGKPCNMTQSLNSKGKYQQDMWLSGTINAVLAMSVAANMVLQSTCGSNYNGVCPTFQAAENKSAAMMKALKSVSFQGVNGQMYKFNSDRQNDVGYTVYVTDNSGNVKQFGSYQGGSLSIKDSTLTSLYSSTPSGCATQCARCTAGTADIIDETFTYMPGDLILAGVFDIHERGSTPFTCSTKLNSRQGYQLLEAFNYAVSYVNNNKGIFKDKLKGIKLGSFSLDSCKSATRIGNLVANIHSQTTLIQSGDQQVNPDHIVSYIGAFDSDGSQKIADVLGNIKVTQVSYGATSVTLQDKQSYPYFLRTVPSDDKQAEAMVALLRDIKVDYVQIVTSDDLYGMDAGKVFSDLAYERRICVAQKTIMPTMEGDINVNADAVVSKLLEKPNATVVMVFLGADYILPFLQAVQRNTKVKNAFQFVGSESWADNSALVDPANQAQQAARNAVSFGVETADVEDFDRYLNNITTQAQKTNPWFREFYENIHQCSLPGGTSGMTPCTDPTRGITSNKNYKQDQYVLYVVNAVFATAMGIDTALTDICGKNYSGLCTGFRYSESQRQEVYEGIQDAEFEDVTGQKFEFTDSGGSRRGYHIYGVISAGNGGYYDDIGSFNTEEGLTLGRSKYSFNGNWKSNCSSPGVCTGCAVRASQRSPFMDTSTDTSVNVMAFFDVHSPDMTNMLKCGRLNTNAGFQSMLAFYYALQNVPGNIDVGGIAMDTCGNPARTTQGLLSLATGENFCGFELDVNDNSVISYMTLGNKDTNAVSNLVHKQGTLILSPSATDSSLLMLNHYLAAVTPDNIQSQVLNQLVTEMQWYYVAVIHSTSLQGQASAGSFIQALRDSKNGVCVSDSIAMGKYPSLDRAKAILTQLNNKPGVQVVLLMVTPHERTLLMQAADDLNLLGRFVFIGSNGDILTDVTSNSARGSVYLKPKSATISEFYNWVATLTVKEHGDIPDDWFEEFWQHIHRCRLTTASVELTEYNIVCPPSLKLTTTMLPPTADVYHTIISTQQLARGLFDLQQCRNTTDNLQSCFHKIQDKYSMLYKSVQDATWVSPDTQQTFRYTAAGYGDGGLDVYNYQINAQGSTDNVKIGSWDPVNGLVLDKSQLVVYTALGEPNTEFSSLCPIGQTCTCVLQTGNNGTGGLPPGNQATAAPLQQFTTDDYFSSALGIILVALTCLGILITIILFVYLLVMYPVKGGTSVLGYVLLFGVLLLYICNFAFIVYPNYEVCAVRRFCLGVIYALIFACMLVKVLNTWRIGDAWDEYNPPTYERLSHPCSLLSIVFGLMLVQVVIGAEWLILRHPDFEMVMYEGKLLPRCSPSDTHNEDLVISLVYVMFLILLTMIFAGVTWDSEENSKESRWILVVCIFTIIIWIIWTIVTTLTDLKFRDAAIVIASLVNATVILLCIYVRKLYLLGKIQKEIEEDKKSQLSTMSREKMNNHGNGYYVNPAYSSLEVGSLRSNKSSHYGSHRSAGSHPRSHNYSYQANAAGADVAY